MNITRLLKILLSLIVLGVVSVAVYSAVVDQRKTPTPTNGEVTIPTGKEDLIQVTTPTANAIVESPLTIEGKARGTWYFEASFPIKLLDGNGNELGVAIAQAQGDWMTTEFVPFKAVLTYSAPATQTGVLVLQKDNPSGLPEQDDQLRIPVTFAPQQQEQRSVKLYYYNPEQDKDASGNLLCSRQGLVAVDRVIPRSVTPIQDTINLLIAGDLSPTEKDRGITTEYPLAGLKLKGATLKNGNLTLEFLDPQHQTGGGSCRVGILWNQIEATAKQFPEVQTVRFIPEELFQP